MKKLGLIAFVLFFAGNLFAQVKVGHVNSQALLDSLPSRKVAMVKLKEFENAGMKELQEMEADLNKSVSIYQAKMKDLSPVMQQIEEEKLMKKQQAFEERQQSLQYEMQAYSQELNGPILKMVQDAVKLVAERKKLNYVIDETITLYFDKALDITLEVAAELKKLDPQ